ncbi:MAG: hypothetical protein M0Z88_02150 [Actinomycetota bacterium]|nr:hypothetical protein [Actinomycetota bacterium]
MHVIATTEPTEIEATESFDARLVWVSVDDRGIELEVVALDLAKTLVVIHVMPTDFRR